MSQQDQQITMLQEQAEDLVGYVQDYQNKNAEVTFQLVQANGSVRRLQTKLEQVQEELRQAQARIAELEEPAEVPQAEPESKPARSNSKAA